MRNTNVFQLSDYRVRRQAREIIAQAWLNVVGEPVPPRDVGSPTAPLAQVFALPLPERASTSRD